MADLCVEMCGVRFKNPVLAAACDYVRDYESIKKVVEAGVGGIVTKTITTVPEARTRPRPFHFPLRRFGKGLEQALFSHELLCHIPPDTWIEKEGKRISEFCRKRDIPLVVTITGSKDLEDWAELAESMEKMGATMVALDISCPHKEATTPTGISRPVAADPGASSAITKVVKDAVRIPVIPKMSPIAEPVSDVAVACQGAGADAIFALDGYPGLALDVEKEEVFGQPSLGGYVPGRTYKPLSLLKVADIVFRCDIPVSGIGGIWEWSDAVEYLLIGCKTVQLATAIYFKGLNVFREIISGLEAFMDRKGYGSVNDFRGKVLDKIIPYDMVPKEKELSVPSEVICKIDSSLCTMCSICVERCPYEALSIKDGKIMVDEENCFGCGMCVSLCPKEGAAFMVHKDGTIVWDGRGIAKSWI